MVIWKDIYLVGLREPSTHHLHMPLKMLDYFDETKKEELIWLL